MTQDLGVKKRITDEVVGPAVASSSSSSNIVYCDGCCFNNGFQNARAGIGIYWSYPNLSSVSERLSGKQTNQRAELVAACKALESASDHNLETIEIRTDSMYTINVVTNWINKWKRNEWKTSSGDEVKNKEDIVKLDHLNSQLRVKWTHIRSHAGDVGNEMADKLAKAGAQAEC
ncbi:uncharacterized protein TRIADDRAFT_28584 [Trichoplax adhaerens]|uniref:ribonuclease H n=1 Tax=Trichoplax adhaerens TaxID=10228 RepID=B3S3Z5_TRIAD|nr:hypothetical protein TRIADDRAFT_28584 [Trichoplax adhaerens]EDV22557.1 hypothetical protein TRIADDRAFT_28584 [Trichoplax adhaerens]|eukprot:XP_002115101.1 hypothetical protein TRIADDRAFT_28584 [Trichoplax adhaerens]